MNKNMGMAELKKNWPRVACILALALLILFLFEWYAALNSSRIREQNRRYALDAIRHRSVRVKDEFTGALNQIQSIAWLAGEALESPEVTPELLERMEKNAPFDALRFTNAAGVTLLSDGTSIESADRDYYLNGMRGESGISVLQESDIFKEGMISFYAPLHYEGKVIGVLRGVYTADEYLRAMLYTSYFGRAVDVFLCRADGRVIASSSNFSYDGPLMEGLFAEGKIDAGTAERGRILFLQGWGEGSFVCGQGSEADNICLVAVPGSNYVLAQAFPRDISEEMVDAANRVAVIVQAVLMSFLFVCALWLWRRTRRERRQLEAQNQDLGYITASVNALFTHFILIDLDKSVYRYLYGTRPKRADFPTEGRYEELIPNICSYFSHGEDAEVMRRTLERDALTDSFRETVPSLQYEYKLDYEGKETWMRAHIICVERREGRARKVVFLWQNVTAIKEREVRAQDEISLAHNRERRFIAATLQDAFCITELNLTKDRVEQVSVSRGQKFVTDCLGEERATALERLGRAVQCSATELFDGWLPNIAEESLEEYSRVKKVAHLNACYARGEKQVELDFWVGGENCREACVRWTCFLSKDEDTGDLMGLVVAKEITSQVIQQREQMRAMEDALRQVRRASHAKSTFLSNMSHDIRTPMNAIMGFTKIALEHIDNQAQVEHCLKKALSSSGHLLNMINDILDMSRIERGGLQLREQPCSLPEIVGDVMDIVQPQIKAKHLELFTSVSQVVNENLVADSLKLCQVFVNLLGNAVKYTPAGGKVSFTIHQRAGLGEDYGEYEFIVRDNGMGIGEDFLSHIYEPFEREQTATKSGIKGAGVGMTITKHIVDLMGGTIDVRSKQGEGTEFRVELRLKLAEEEKKEERPEALAGLRALVLDEDIDACDSVSRMLRQLGLRPDGAISGEEAVTHMERAKMERDPYGICFVNWQMAQMSGLEATERLRAMIGPEAPIVVMSVYDWTDIEDEARRAGATSFCEKPLFMSQLRALLMSSREAEDGGASKRRISFKGKRVLLVDDIDMNREIAQAILEEAGFVVETAGDGTEAVAMVQNSEERYYDAILTDIQMPIMDGLEEAMAIRALPRGDVADMPIIAISANASPEDKEKSLLSGIDAHIPKPLDVELFISLLRKYLIEKSGS